LTDTHEYGRDQRHEDHDGIARFPAALLREAKTWAAGRGVSLRQLFVEALAQKLRAEKTASAAKPWLKAFRDLEVDDELRRELRRLNQRVEAACERVEGVNP